jgi:hypothetical protein
MTTPPHIAYHEAGHALVGLALDIGITKLEARGCRYCPCSDPRTWWRYAVMALGGPAAEQRYACYPIDIVAAQRDSTWAADYQRAYDWLRVRPGVTLAQAEAKARHLVNANWLYVGRIAQALAVMGELDGADLPRVVCGDLGWWLRWQEQDAPGELSGARIEALMG